MADELDAFYAELAAVDAPEEAEALAAAAEVSAWVPWAPST